MALEQKLSLRLSQKLVMTPSLQQAIKLLQMTRLELEGVLNQELEENPVLETADEVEEGSQEAEQSEQQSEASEAESQTAEESAEATAEEADDGLESMDDIDLDAYFNDYLDASESLGGQSQTFEQREAVPIENTLTREQDLYDHLLWQLHMLELPSEQRELAELIIGNLNTDGFLVATIEEIQLLGADEEELQTYEMQRKQYDATMQILASARSEEEDAAGSALSQIAGPEPPPIPGYARAEVEAALELVQSFDPPGVACPDLRQSLLHQLERLGEEESLAYRMVSDSWEKVLKRQFQAIAKEYGMALKELEEPVELIRTLETRPGRQFSGERAQYVEPDVAVVKVGDQYVIQLNDDGMPRLRVSRAYRRMLQEMRREGRQTEAQQFIKEKMRSAVWLIKSLDQRQRTIYKVADSIVRQQQGFLERGIDHLRPMVLRDVAEDIGMHESTVSRVVSNKYIHTPRGLYPMKFFFHSGIDSAHGDDVSSLSVKRKIQQLIQNENPKKPLSDSQLMRTLNSEGIKIARRTVAKYRDELSIPSSTDRKQVF